MPLIVVYIGVSVGLKPKLYPLSFHLFQVESISDDNSIAFARADVGMILTYLFSNVESVDFWAFMFRLNARKTKNSKDVFIESWEINLLCRFIPKP